MHKIKTVVCETECDERINTMLKEGWFIARYERCPRTESREFIMGKKRKPMISLLLEK